MEKLIYIVEERGETEFWLFTFIYFLNEVVDGKAEECHEQTKDEDEHPVYDVGEDLRRHPVPYSWGRGEKERER